MTAPGEQRPGEQLGATVADGATHFVVASSVAERIELCLFGRDGAEGDRLDLTPGDDGCWRATVVGAGHGQRYGFRVHGPGDPAIGHACDPAKLVIDPAARRLSGDLRWARELTVPGVDSAPHVPRSVVVAPGQTVAPGPRTPWDATVAYEAHVGQLTACHPMVAAERRGRYPGLAEPVVIDHLLRLGVTAVELLPVQHFVSEAGLVATGRRNVWGYNPLGWGAPHAGYATAGGDPVAELRAAVAGLHGAGIEVWLDVVFNHTCEGSLGTGPILSLRGFDNADSYRLVPGPHGLVDEDVTGCGNAVDTRSPVIRRLIRECLVRWVVEFGVDGFRFDLAATLARGDHGPHPDADLLVELAAEPALDGVKLVAEPWDLGPDGYAVGRFPAPWREWNDRFRDDLRDRWRGSGTWSATATRLTGSADLFARSGRDASTSVNAVATHDGFTTADLVTYDHPVEGHGQRSWNGGLEGPTADPVVVAGRRRRQRALLASALLAQGVPTLLAGDELGRSQGGHANGYTVEATTSGIAWAEGDWDLAAWVGAAVELRHRHPVLRRSRWIGPDDPGVTWRAADGAVLEAEDWADHDRRSVSVELTPDPVLDGPGRAVLVLLAAGGPPDAPAVDFRLPPGGWEVALDAAHARPPRPGGPPVGERRPVDPYGLVVLVAADPPD